MVMVGIEKEFTLQPAHHYLECFLKSQSDAFPIWFLFFVFCFLFFVFCTHPDFYDVRIKQSSLAMLVGTYGRGQYVYPSWPVITTIMV